MKGAKDLSIVNDISRDIIENLEKIDKVTIDEEEQAVPESRNSSKCMYFYVIWPSNSCFCQDNRLQILNCTQDSTFRAVKAPIAAKEELLEGHRDVVDGHLQLPDEGVAALFDEDGEKLPVEVIKEELEVRATVPSATAGPLK